MNAKVYIVGAGPADAALITVRGLRALRRAGVVLYDRLAARRLLAEAPPSAELISVGKRPDAPSVSQDEINALMVEKARDGRIVVRLKGGDPLIFGRGAEEADFLAAAGIDFEIIPGITAASGAAAFAGVPLTDRRTSSCVTFVTARRSDCPAAEVDWDALARTGGTIVVYMGRAGLEEVAARLIKGGLDTETPAVVVERATESSQRVVSGSLFDIAGKCDAAGLQAPCVAIVGKAAAARQGPSWFERLPLFGKAVVITRMHRRREDLPEALSALGADVIELPTIEIQPASPERLRSGLGGLSAADWVVFTSSNGVDIFFDALHATGRDSRALSGRKVAAVGPATALSLSQHGITADLLPDQSTGRKLLEKLLEASTEGQVFFLWRAAAARRELADGLVREGREVLEVAAYEAVCPEEFDAEVVRCLKDKCPSAVLFSSASTAANFCDILGRQEALDLMRAAKVVSIGPVTTQALRRLGAPPDVEAEDHTAPGLLAATLKALDAG